MLYQSFHWVNIVIKCLNLGHKLSLRNNSAGFINCAVNKGIFLKQNLTNLNLKNLLIMQV